ncbi:MAG: hypothetical protein M0T77_11245 [Actinomycetota bacterium]|nr:hypothetical protein [Actinomycetota bacterium]
MTGPGSLVAGDGTPILTATAAAVVTINTARTPHAVRMHPPFYRTAEPARHARLRDARRWPHDGHGLRQALQGWLVLEGISRPESVRERHRRERHHDSALTINDAQDT